MKVTTLLTNKQIHKLVLLVFIGLFFLIKINESSININAANDDFQVPATAYEFDKGSDYEIEGANPVTMMAFGDETIGNLSISGNINETSLFSNRTAYGIENGNLSISYVYDGALLNQDLDNYLVDDKSKDINGLKLESKIMKGVLILQKSEDGSSWESIADPVVNFFEEYPKGVSDFYTTSGSDITKGYFYRVIVAYKTKNKIGETKILLWEKDKYEIKEHVEIYEFYACSNSGITTIHNLSTEENDFEEIEGISLNIVKKGETLVDGSLTTSGFTIGKMSSSYEVTVNGERVFDRQEFTDEGHYSVVTTTKLGKTVTDNVYIFGSGDEKGLHAYFDETLVQGKRVFREGAYPTYDINSVAKINGISAIVPDLYGEIMNMTTGEKNEAGSAKDEEQIFKLEPGEYQADFYSGNKKAGSVIHYTFRFNILNEEALPYVNNNTLMNLDRLSDLSSKHYETVFQTTAGGYIYVCFADYQDAFNYAYDIEKRFVENTEDGVYYKAENNPNQKIRYDVETTEDKVYLTGMLNKYARKNVELAYFDSNEKFSYQTFKNEEDLLNTLESMSIFESIKVFPSKEEKEKFLQRKPYINGFQFIQVDDYDVVSVVAQCKEDDNSYPIAFDILVDEQLSVTSDYTIVEKNRYGDVLTYDVCFMAENMTESIWEIENDGNVSTVIISENAAEEVTIEITTDRLYIKNATNKYDDQAIVLIEAPDVYEYDIKCLVSELRNLVIHKKGKYRIVFTDRVGNRYLVKVNITGEMQYDENISDGRMSYMDLYNEVHINKKTEEELIR